MARHTASSSTGVAIKTFGVAGLLVVAILASRPEPQNPAAITAPPPAEQPAPKTKDGESKGAAGANNGKGETDKPAATITAAQPVIDILDRADKAYHRGHYAEALSAYTQISAMTELDAALRYRAKLGLAWASMGKSAVDNPTGWAAVQQSIFSLWKTSLTGLGTLAGWIAILAAAAGLIVTGRLLIPAKYDLQIDLQDLAGTDRDNGSHLLSAEVQEILFPRGSGGDELMFESMTDFGGGSSASIKPVAHIPGLDSLLSTVPVVVGPLQFTPAALWGLLLSVFQPRHSRTLAGALFVQGTRTAVNARLLTKTGAIHQNAWWLLSADGADSRRAVLRQITARVTIEISDGRSISNHPQSLEATMLGMDLLRASPTAAPSQATQHAAATAFQNAVGYDPGNWMARFNLSVLLRQLGNEEEAIQHCKMLRDLLGSRNRPASLEYYVKAHPHFGASIEYNQALALAQVRTWNANKEAIQLLDSLIARRDDLLSPLAESARAAALLFQFDGFHKNPDASKPQKEVEEKVTGAVRKLDALAQTRVSSRSLELARCVALNARGYIADKNGDREAARNDFETAATLNPDFVDVHLNLGRLYRHGGNRLATDWIVRAKSHITMAISLQPENREANYQMGRLLADEAVRKFSEALPWFDKAQPHSIAAFFAGRIYCDSGFCGFDMEKGIEQLRTAANLAPEPDFRVLVLVDRLIDYADQLLKQANVAAAQVTLMPASIVDRDKYCARARRLLKEADAHIGHLRDAGNRSTPRLEERLAQVLQAAEQNCTSTPTRHAVSAPVQLIPAGNSAPVTPLAVTPGAERPTNS
jgi:tetratricopeptide (TPR) repeat protein